jgi:hypothetical protein
MKCIVCVLMFLIVFVCIVFIVCKYMNMLLIVFVYVCL